MKILACILGALVIFIAGSAWAIDELPIRNIIDQLPQALPAKPIGRVSIVPVNDSSQGGDVMIDYTDGSTFRISTGAQAQAAQLAPDGQTFGFNIVEYYVDTKGDLWVATRAIVFYKQGKRLSFIEPEKQATVGWAFRNGSSSAMVSAAGTHGPTFLSLWDIAKGKRVADADDNEEKKPLWTKGPQLLFCCTVKTIVRPSTR